jgi:ADP-ribose pyrophosphatase YjhB (NUDIX family)
MADPAFCFRCGGPLAKKFIEEEERERLACESCGHIHYLNPHLVSGTIPTNDGSALLLRRAIEPRYGYWTFPAGFMELGESIEEAALRETREELNLDCSIQRLLGVYSRPTWQNVLVVYLATPLAAPSPGREALEVRSFTPSEIPWSHLAFPSTREAMRDWVTAIRAADHEASVPS